MRLTREQAITEHRKMWNWIADETKNLKRKVEKEEYFSGIRILDIPSMQCYCCEFSIYYPNCCEEHCIIDWGKDKSCIESYYSEWFYADDWQEAERLARIIAELPERKTNE